MTIFARGSADVSFRIAFNNLFFVTDVLINLFA